jgi:hypothetical protein
MSISSIFWKGSRLLAQNEDSSNQSAALVSMEGCAGLKRLCEATGNSKRTFQTSGASMHPRQSGQARTGSSRLLDFPLLERCPGKTPAQLC